MSINYPPKLDLAYLPSPLQPMRRLSKILADRIHGAQIWIKRDDLTGSATGGNKVRKLEFLLAQALAERADVIITCGGIQSNHCRATALLAAQLGLKCHLLLRQDSPFNGEGNLIFNHLANAEMTVIEKPRYVKAFDAIKNEVLQHYRQQGQRPFFIPTGGSNSTGLWGYIQCVNELLKQCRQFHLNPDYIVHATGSGGTQAGLMVGQILYEMKTTIAGVMVCDDAAYFTTKISSDVKAFIDAYQDYCEPTLISRLLAEIDSPSLPTALIDGYIGPGYAKGYDALFETINLVSRHEGIVLDPVYSGKAFHGLINELENGCLAGAKQVVFIHTGGLFGIYPFTSQLITASKRNPH